jgi:hypothetical protein
MNIQLPRKNNNGNRKSFQEKGVSTATARLLFEFSMDSQFSKWPCTGSSLWCAGVGSTLIVLSAQSASPFTRTEINVRDAYPSMFPRVPWTAKQEEWYQLSEAKIISWIIIVCETPICKICDIHSQYSSPEGI